MKQFFRYFGFTVLALVLAGVAFFGLRINRAGAVIHTYPEIAFRHINALVARRLLGIRKEVNMDWVQDFYQNQAQWSGAYWGDVHAGHREKAALLQELVGDDHQTVLELGAGGGQNAVAVAELGHDVVAIEIVPELARHIQQLSKKYAELKIRVIEADFYQVALGEQFDVICYWDGFGIGTDAEQRRLLRRMSGWLKKDGYALIDVYTPWHAAKSAGYQQQVGVAQRRYEFDADQCRWLDHWWVAEQAGRQVTQSLRCYSPADLRLLLEGSGLELMCIRPGGMMDYETGKFTPQAPLHQAMWFLAALRCA